jgi:predicted MFS family arabinose efflux permease
VEHEEHVARERRPGGPQGDEPGIVAEVLRQALLQAGSELSVFTVFYGLDWIATVPPTVRLATDAFGKDEAPVVFGWVLAAHQVGAALAALGAGLIRTELGDYRVAFIASGGLCLGAACLALAIGRHRAVGVPLAATPADA